MEDKIYVVTGACGEYSSYAEWTVCWFPTEVEAQTYAQLADAASRQLYGAALRHRDIPEGANPYDPRMQTDYSGPTGYDYYEVPRGHLDKPEA